MNNSYFRTIAGSAMAFIIIVFGSYVIAAKSATTGNWRASTKEKQPGELHISFERKSEKYGKNSHGSFFSYDDLRGLTPEQTKNGRVRFSIVREAGTLDCEGSFTDGVGTGTFQFNANESFVQGMRSRGFEFNDERLFSATTLNLTLAFADNLLSANFGKLDTDDLFKALIFKITPEFMAEMKATGFPNLGMEELVKARIFKIDAKYVREIKDMGFGVTDFENLVKYRIFKVTPEFLAEMKNEGLTDIDPEDVVKLRIFKIDAAYVRQARAEDPNISVEKIVQKKIGAWSRN